MMIRVKEYMESIRQQEERLQFKQDQIESMENDIPKLARNTPQIQAIIQESIREVQRQAEQMNQAFLQDKQEAIRLLETIKPESARILVYRYWEKKTMPEIGKIMYMSERHAYRQLNSATAEFQAVLDAREARKVG